MRGKETGGEPLISIIVPVYNVEKYICKCIDSIVGQTYQRLEIILVDDGSHDESGKICDKYQALDSRIIVIHKENGGLADARNAGLDVAQGIYVMFVDSDDYLSRECVYLLYCTLIEKNANIAICPLQSVYEGKNAVAVDESGRGNTKILIWDSRETLYFMLLQKYITTSACGVLSKRECWKNVRFPKGKICEDLGTSYKIYSQVTRIAYINRPLYYYLIRKGSIQNTGYTKAKMDELELALECKKFIESRYPDLRQAAINRLLSSSFHILFFMENFQDAPEDSRMLMDTIRQYRRQAIFGRNINKKVRFGCLCSYAGFGLTRWIYNKLGMRGRINF